MTERLSALDTRSKVLGGALALAVLALVAWLLLLGREEEAVVAVPVAAPAAGATTAPPLVDGVPDAPVPDPPLGSAKDPFRALYVVPAAPVAVPAQAPAPFAPAQDDPEEDAPLAGPPLPVPAGPGASTGEPGAPAVPGPVAAPSVLVLEGVEGEGPEMTATFTVDDATRTAKVGEAFAGLTLLALQQGPRPGQWTAVVQEEGSDPFDLVSGAPRTL